MMVKGRDSELYQKLKQRFDNLTLKHQPIDLILSKWEEKGVDAAMSLYYTLK